ncbi:inositol-pentakisphosphate 2-kinase-like [Dendronephthya gigantea]|uniref:inositol-pentakisphosphate 2-kinase-like n=1 Tax=Dendronephthya gigantea TaxID=151771 RepID=UPI00106DC32C|nr:inositol-pentakisphosphate 2-kinase-like [Dendronephthya gigantea]
MAYISASSKWFYRGEGNRTLVISNPQTQKVLRLQKSNVASTDQTNSAQDSSGKAAEKLRLELEKSIKLYQEVFTPLLGAQYVEHGAIVELPGEFMANIKDLVTSANTNRPKHRLNKEVNGQNKYGILMPDFCFVPSGDGINANEASRPTFCVEIKPKCGTMPACKGLESGEYKDVKQSVCKYCLFQWTKVYKDEKYLQRSGYCPLDLFSSDIRRVWYALTCLLNNPQNNFRIFQDGNMMYSGETMAPSCGSMVESETTEQAPSTMGSNEHHLHLSKLEEFLSHSFLDSTQDMLTNHNVCGEKNGSNMQSTTVFLATLLQLLIYDSNENTVGCGNGSNHHPSKHPVCLASQYHEADCMTGTIPAYMMSKGLTFAQGGVLKKILDVQRLDDVGTDEAFCIFNNLYAIGVKDMIDLHIFAWNESQCSVNANENTNANPRNVQINANYDQVHANINYKGKITDCCITNGNSLAHVNKHSVTSKLDSLTKFLIAASANDCSIMISFQEVIGPLANSNCFRDLLTGRVYKYSIAIVDLDQKLADRIPKYYKEYNDIIDNYLSFKNNVEL